MRAWVKGAAAAALGMGVLAGGAARAEAPPREEEPGWRLTPSLMFEERATFGTVSAVEVGRPVASDETRLEPSRTLEHRLRVGAELKLEGGPAWLREARLALGGDLFGGALWYAPRQELLAFDPRDPSQPVDALLVRQALLEVTNDYGRVSVGRTPSHWGLGVLANAATEDPYTFGLSRVGHVVDRASLTIAPAAGLTSARYPQGLPLYVTVALDRLVRDDLMDTADGDHGDGKVAAVLFKDERLELGAYGVTRHLRDARGLGIDALAADVYGAFKTKAGPWQLQVATEWAFIGGEATWFRTPSQPEGYDLSQLGGVVRLQADADRFGARLEAGYASGDSRPYDDTLHAMTFATDYRVGLVLFPELQRRTTAVAAYNLQDERFTGSAPVGFERLPTGGGVSQAMYVNPVVRVRPLPELTLLGGVLLARAPTDVTDPYRTAQAGGAPTGPRGAAGERNLGIELDGAVAWTQPIGQSMAVEARVDVGVLFPGGAFDDADGHAAAAVGAALGQVRVRGSW